MWTITIIPISQISFGYPDHQLLCYHDNQVIAIHIPNCTKYKNNPWGITGHLTKAIKNPTTNIDLLKLEKDWGFHQKHTKSGVLLSNLTIKHRNTMKYYIVSPSIFSSFFL